MSQEGSWVGRLLSQKEIFSGFTVVNRLTCVGIIRLCNVVVHEYGPHLQMAERDLVAILTSSFARPNDLLPAVVTEVGSTRTLNPLRFRGATSRNRSQRGPLLCAILPAI